MPGWGVFGWMERGKGGERGGRGVLFFAGVGVGIIVSGAGGGGGDEWCIDGRREPL